MDRRKSIKSIILGSVAGGLALNGCKPETEDGTLDNPTSLVPNNYGRTPKEAEHNEALAADQFFNEHEMQTLGVLCALILPANGKNPSATDVGVPGFIEFIMKDMPNHQTPIRGGLMWLDHTSNSNYQTEFKSLLESEQKSILDTIAFPDIETPLRDWPIQEQFFLTLRNLTLTGYYTTKEGIEDLGYKGNQFNIWDGVPEDVLQQHNMSYDPDWLAKCIDQNTRNEIAVWDNDGNLLS